MTILIALIIGLVVSGQTFYLFTLENLKHFATLKAVGVATGRVARMVLLQALVAGFIGYALGTLLAAGFFELTAHKTATRGIILMWQNVALVAGLMFLVVGLASLLSIRKVLRVEPATVFRA